VNPPSVGLNKFAANIYYTPLKCNNKIAAVKVGILLLIKNSGCGRLQEPWP
jgi:hypothetical protein